MQRPGTVPWSITAVTTKLQQMGRPVTASWFTLLCTSAGDMWMFLTEVGVQMEK